MTDDILSRAEPFLNVCGACDAGVPTSCTCPTGDYRPIMLALVREVERLRAAGDQYGPLPPGACPCCGDRVPLGEYGICVPCAAPEGWDPECTACLTVQAGRVADGEHLGTCAAGRKVASR